MQNNFFYITTFTLLSFVSNIAYAVCPLCTVAVGAGLGVSHWFGVDDVISGLWIGGFTMSLVTWTINWLNQKKIHFKGRKILITTIYYILIIASLSVGNIIGSPLNTLWGIDKLILGIIIGSITFLSGYICYTLIKKRQGHAHFPFQKVVMPVAPLVLLTLIFHYTV